MVDHIRYRHDMGRLLLEKNPSITNYIYHPTHFDIPPSLPVPEELRIAHDKLHERALDAIQIMKHIMHFNNHRFSFLCPQKPKHVWKTHCDSMIQLRDWKEDTYPRNSVLRRDATLAPRPKLPRGTIHLRLDAQNYGRFFSSYASILDKFLCGEWREYFAAKSQTQEEALRLLDQVGYYEWKNWWEGKFQGEMLKWENCVNSLAMPLWEDVIDELYLMIVDCVEDADDFAESLCQIGSVHGKGDIGSIESGKTFVQLEDVGIENIHVYLDENTIDLSCAAACGLDAEDPEASVCPMDTRSIDLCSWA